MPVCTEIVDIDSPHCPGCGLALASFPGTEDSEVLEIEVSVDLRRGDTGVTEHFLHRAQVTGRLQYMRGEAVSQHVRMRVARQPLTQGTLGQALLDGPHR